MRTAALIGAGIIAWLLAGLVLSEIIGIAGVLASGTAAGSGTCPCT